MARKPTTWSIKGIEEDVRDIARAAAEREEQTIGAWIDHAIRVHGGQRPRPEPVAPAVDPELSGSSAPAADPDHDPAHQAPALAASASAEDADNLLEIIDHELIASSSRLDTALRPMGLALLDLAERMVALERGDGQARGPSDLQGRLEADELAFDGEDDFGPEGESVAGDISEDTLEAGDEDFGHDADAPQEAAPEQEPQDLSEQDLSEQDLSEASGDDGRPGPPDHDLDADLDALDMPVLPGGPSQRAREIDRRLRALAGEVQAAGREDEGAAHSAGDEDDLGAPPPPTWDLGPVTFEIAPPDAAPDSAPDPAPVVEDSPLELPMAFRGLQQAGYESDRVAADQEELSQRRYLRRRRIRRLFTGLVLLAVVGAVSSYVFADKLGLAPLRAKIDHRLEPALTTARREAALLWHGAADLSQPVLEGLQDLIGGNGDRQEDRQAEQSATEPDAAEMAPSQAANVSADDHSDPAPAMPDSAALPEPAPDVSSVSSATSEEANGATADPDTDTESVSVTSPVTAPDAAPKPAGGKLQAKEETAKEESVANVPTAPILLPPVADPAPVPVPDAAPAPKVSEVAPPPVPALPKLGRPALDPGITDDQVAALPRGTGGVDSALRASLQRKADAGDPRAQHDLAIAYLTGNGGPEDPARAAELLREAAIQGLAAAQYNLAVLYENGEGVRQDDVRALLWYHSAAEQGHPNAQYNLGVMYAEGRGIPLDFKEAARWFRSAADQGLARALYNLAVMTDEGLGIPQDKEKARTLYEEAAEAGDRRAIAYLATGKDDEATSAMPPAELNGAEGVQTSKSASASMVASAQEQLSRLGLYRGRVDGLIGPKTRAAIRMFQLSADMEPDGEVTASLLSRLEKTAP